AAAGLYNSPCDAGVLELTIFANRHENTVTPEQVAIVIVQRRPSVRLNHHALQRHPAGECPGGDRLALVPRAVVRLEQLGGREPAGGRLVPAEPANELPAPGYGGYIILSLAGLNMDIDGQPRLQLDLCFPPVIIIYPSQPSEDRVFD